MNTVKSRKAAKLSTSMTEAEFDHDFCFYGRPAFCCSARIARNIVSSISASRVHPARSINGLPLLFPNFAYFAAMSYYESKIYAPILPSGKAYQFYFLQEVKSFITHPSPGLAMKGPGFYEISGFAYSGNGRISKVMRSFNAESTFATSCPALNGLSCD